VKVGAAKVTYTPNGGSAVVLGFTKEGAEIAVKRSKFDIKVHELGETPVGSVWTGCEIGGKITLQEWSLDNVALALSSTKTTVAGPPAKVSVDVDPRAGAAVPVGKLVFHPKALADVDVTEDVTLPLVELEVDTPYSFKVNAERALVFGFRAIVNKNTTDPTKLDPLMTIGDPTTAVVFTP
jgi:hypothetical protein